MNSLCFSTDELCQTALVPSLPGHELSEQMEISLTNKLFQRCKKRREHKHFIEFKDFQMEHLPQSGRCQEGLDFVKNIASRTVRNLVNFTSPDRPKRWRIACENLNKKRYGTGFVDSHVNLPDDKFMVKTAAHVVFNKDELKETWVNFFYDGDQNSPGMVKAKALSLESVSETIDSCHFICQVESPEIGRRVKARLFTPRYNRLPPDLRLAFCVSHPHGTTKKVAFGKIKSKGEERVRLVDKDCTIICFMFRHIRDSNLISDKSVLYFAVQSVVFPGSQFVKIIKQYQPSLLAPEALLLWKLVGKCLLKTPSPREFDLLQKSLAAAKEEIEQKVTHLWSNIHRGLSLSEREKQKKKIFNKFMSQESLNLPDVWRQRMVTVLKELHELCRFTNERRICHAKLERKWAIDF